MLTIALGATAALLWGIADFGAGLQSRRTSALVVTAGMLGVGAVVAAIALLLAQPAPLRLETTELGLVAGLATAAGLAGLYRALAIGRMGVVAPISAAGVVLPVAAGLAHGEHPAPAQLTGMGLVVAGVLYVVARAADPEPRDGRASSAGIVPAIFSAVCLGVYYIAAGGLDDPAQGGWFSLLGQGSACLAVAVVVAARRPVELGRAEGLRIVALGVLGAATWLLSAAAFARGELSVVSTVISLYPVITVLLAALVLRERLQRGQWLALAVTFAGVALISGG